MRTEAAMRLKIAVVDGQGAGIGRALIEKLREALGDAVEIMALGTNALATSVMLKAGADEGASGENAIVFNAARVDVIVGTIGVIAANSLLGELTPAMARAIGESPAEKVLVPMNRCHVQVAGLRDATLPQYIDDAVALVRRQVERRPS